MTRAVEVGEKVAKQQDWQSTGGEGKTSSPGGMLGEKGVARVRVPGGLFAHAPSNMAVLSASSEENIKAHPHSLFGVLQ